MPKIAWLDTIEQSKINRIAYVSAIHNINL